MNENKEHLEIQEERSGGELIYQLDDNDRLYLTGYKVLQNVGGKVFLKCQRTTLNGKTRLVYDVSAFKTMLAMLPILTESLFVDLIAGMLEAVHAIQDNSFIQGENVSTCLDNVFIDAKDRRAYFIYLPIVVESDATMQLDDFQSRLRELILCCIDRSENLQTPRLLKIKRYLEKSAGPLEGVSQFLYEPKIGADTVFVDSSRSVSSELCFVRQGGTQTIVIPVAQGAMVVGRSSPPANFSIRDDSVSSSHCRIIREGDCVFLEDLRSTNGTFVDDRRLAPHERVEIHLGCKVKISRFVFYLEKSKEPIWQSAK